MSLGGVNRQRSSRGVCISSAPTVLRPFVYSIYHMVIVIVLVLFNKTHIKTLKIENAHYIKKMLHLFILLSLSVDSENYVSLILFSAPGIAIGLHLALYKLLLN